MASPLNAAHQNLPFPPNRTLALKNKNAIHSPYKIRIDISAMLT